LGKSVHLNRPGKKHNSGLGLPPIAVAKINKKKQKTILSHQQMNYIQIQTTVVRTRVKTAELAPMKLVRLHQWFLTFLRTRTP